jgi:hypothetical protein
MSNSASQTVALFGNDPVPRVGQVVGIAVAIWLVVISILGADGAFVGAPGQPPLPVFASAVAPVVVFGIAWRMSQAFAISC